jgi:DNA invertase Pin-like site-specific DNA recombinase
VTRALLYCRQSVEKEEGERSLSLDSQVTALADRCQREGWTVVGVVRESGLKGYQDVDERPGMAEAMRRAESGDYDTLLVWDLSRLARSLRLQEQWVWQFDRLGVTVVSHSEPHATDTLLRQITGAISEHSTREIASHVRRALRENTRRGIPHGSAPYGYSRGDGKILTPNAHAPTVERIYRWYADGRSLGDIAGELRREGVPGPTGSVWHRTTLTELLRNPVYTGTLCLSELAIPNVHPPIVDADLWQRAQAVAKTRPRSPRTKQTRSWLEGLILHACGYPMYLVGGSASRPVPAFRCRIGAGWGPPDVTCQWQPRQIVAGRAESLAWEAVIEAFSILPPSPRAVIREAQAEYRRLSPASDAAYKDALVRQNKALQRRERVLEAYLSGDIDRARFDRESVSLDAELRNAELDLARLPNPPDGEAIESAWSALHGMKPMLRDVSESERGAWLRNLGVAVVSPAGYTVSTGKRGSRPDAGRIVMRFRSEYAVLFGQHG